MTAIATTSADLAEARPATTSSRSAALRRGFFVASPILAGILLLVATIADPAAGGTGPEVNRAYTENPGALQWHSLALHWSYAFWGVTAFMAAAYVKGRGSVLANIGAIAGFVGMTTLPGILAVDWYDSSIGQVYGVDAISSLHEHMDKTLWALPFFAAPGIIGLLLCMPVAAAALWRGGVVRWWSFAAALAGTVTFIGSGVTVWGVSLTAVLFTVLGVDLALAARGLRGPDRAARPRRAELSLRGRRASYSDQSLERSTPLRHSV